MPVPAHRVRSTQASSTGMTAAAAFPMTSIPLTKINPSLDPEKFSSELKSLSREFSNYKNEIGTQYGEYIGMYCIYME